MHTIVFYLIVLWTAVLFGITVILIIRSHSTMVRILMLDTLNLLLITLLALFADANRSAHYLDAALLLALLAFVATLAAARYQSERKVFS